MKKKRCLSRGLALLLSLIVFALAVKPPVMVSGATGSYQTPYAGGSKKGIQVDMGMISDVEDLGISEAFFNITFSEILSASQTKYSYEHNGNTYYFNERIVEDYDTVVKRLSDMGANVTIAFLNRYAQGYEYLLYPGISPVGGVTYYAINTATDEGRNAVEAVCRFVASRYNGGEYGLISNYVVGNEVNDNKVYNYIGEMDIDRYVSIYYDTFKTIYNAVRAENGSANLYIPLEQRWTTENSAWDYAGRDFLEKFDALSKADGNLYWNLAYHPYSFPITNTNVLTDGWASVDKDGKTNDGGEITDSADTKLISMKNINVLTDFMQSESMKNKDGEVRSIILSEQGFTSYSPITKEVNETLQAASIAYSYYAAEMNPYIDAYILNGQTDVYAESEYYKFGLWNSDSNNNATTKKQAYDVYKYIDTNLSLQVTEFALETLGIESWQAAIPDFDADKFNNMKSVTEGTVYAVASETAAGQVLSADMAVDGTTGSSSYWNAGYNCHTFSIHDHAGNYYPGGLAVLDGAAYYLASQSLEHVFDTPLDLSGKPYLSFALKLISSTEQQKSDKLIVRIRVYSGTQVYDANCEVTAGTDNNLAVDLSGWEYRDSVDKISIWFREKEGSTSFDGTAAVYNLTVSEGVTGAAALTPAISIAPANIEAYPFNATEYNGQDYSLIYNPEYYYSHNTDLAGLGYSPVLLLDHFISSGMSEQRQASETFDLKAYMEYNPDITAALGNNYSLYYLHYLTTGYSEGRKAVYGGSDTGTEEDIENIDSPYSDVFNASYYYKNNPDLADSCGKDAQKLLDHFVSFGMAEGRIASASFNVKIYKQNYGDLRDQFGDDWTKYYMHYINAGKAEGRIAIVLISGGETGGSGDSGNNGGNTDTDSGNSGITEGSYIVNGLDYSVVFNADYYYSNNLDLQAAVGKDAGKLFEHFCNYGMSEGRQGSKDFNVAIYKNNYTDLQNAFGDNLKQYYAHYVKDGKPEGRNATTAIDNSGNSGSNNGETGVDYHAVFDAEYYATRYKDVVAVLGTDPETLYNHFIQYGVAENRQGCAEFDVAAYKGNYSDLRDAFGSDVWKYYDHYIQCGKAEGRIAVFTLMDLVFDADYYYDHNPDVAAVTGHDEQLLYNHYIFDGMAEGRQASAGFDPKYYKASYKDLQEVCGDGSYRPYVEHYLSYGYNEGRNKVVGD